MRTFAQIADSVCVSQTDASKTDERVILFLKLRDGERWTEELVSQVKSAIRESLSPRHVPALVLPVSDIPVSLPPARVCVCVSERR